MQEVAPTDTQFYLIALGLSEQASRAISAYRKALWQENGNMSFLCLPAIIPIAWNYSSFHSLKQEKIPLPPSPMNFNRVTHHDDTFFLVPGTNYLETWISSVQKQLHVNTLQQSTSLSFPMRDGIFLGIGSEIHLSESKVQTPHIINTSWNLQQYHIVWEKNDSQENHVHYQLLFNQHLT
jgi:hypothetical protein